MHAAWSGSAEVFRSVVVAIEDNLGRDQVRLSTHDRVQRRIFEHSSTAAIVAYKPTHLPVVLPYELLLADAHRHGDSRLERL